MRILKTESIQHSCLCRNLLELADLPCYAREDQYPNQLSSVQVLRHLACFFLCLLVCMLFFFFQNIYLVCSCAPSCISAKVRMWRSEDHFYGSRLSFHQVASGMKLRSPGLTANTFTHWPISPALKLKSKNKNKITSKVWDVSQ